jgi:hypothetical protein
MLGLENGTWIEQPYDREHQDCLRYPGDEADADVNCNRLLIPYIRYDGCHAKNECDREVKKTN